MYIAELFFKFRSRRASRQDIELAIIEALMALEHNGQLVDRELTIARVPGGYRAIVALPESSSLRPSLHNEQVRASLRRLRECGISGPHHRSLGKEFESNPVCRCRKSSALILQPNVSGLPIRCGDCFGVVPFYRLRRADVRWTYGDILHWQHRYDWLDDLWTDSGVGERFAYRELSRPDSDLSKEGRAVCRRIEQQSEIPVYYHLHHFSARSSAADQKRPCPGCGRKWLLRESWHWYEFRCDRCRLVS